MKVCFTRSCPDPPTPSYPPLALAQVMRRQQLTGGTLHNDSAVILIMLDCKNKALLTVNVCVGVGMYVSVCVIDSFTHSESVVAHMTMLF